MKKQITNTLLSIGLLISSEAAITATGSSGASSNYTDGFKADIGIVDFSGIVGTTGDTYTISHSGAWGSLDLNIEVALTGNAVLGGTGTVWTGDDVYLDLTNQTFTATLSTSSVNLNTGYTIADLGFTGQAVRAFETGDAGTLSSDGGVTTTALVSGWNSYDDYPVTSEIAYTSGAFELGNIWAEVEIIPNTVPEPSSAALLGLGAFSLLARRKR